MLFRSGARRFVTQSFAGWPYGRSGKRVKTEDDQLDPQVPKQMRPALHAIRYMEEAVLGADGLDGLVLRYGGFYGPGTGLEPGGPHFEMVRKRRFPIVGDGGGVWSFIHIEDAAEATAAAITGGEPGVYNVVDDDPAPVSEWLPELAAALGAKPPRRLPLWVARLVGGEHFVALMTDVRGASNTKARHELGWNPRHASWREGFRELAA